jgi:hypothetical protein
LSHLALVALFILSAFQARGSLLSTITDTDTGLTWLPLTDTLDMSFLQVSAQLGPGGEFAGFSYATVAQVEQLWIDAGVTGPNLGCNPAAVCLNESVPTEVADNFTELFGETFTPIFGFQGMIGLTATPYVSPWPGCAGEPYNCYVTPEIRIFPDGTSEALVIEALRDYIALPYYGSWLVEGSSSVPEPKSIWSTAIGTMMIICFATAFKGRRKRVPPQSSESSAAPSPGSRGPE